MPALLTAMCSSPNASRHASTIASTAAGSVTSTSNGTARPPLAAMDSATDDADGAWTSAMSTEAPDAASVRATASPIPVPAPVTIAARSRSS